MKFLEKIQNLPESKKKFILWASVIILAIVLLAFYFRSFENRIKNFKTEKLKEELKKLPGIKMPPELKQIEEETKETPQITPII